MNIFIIDTQHLEELRRCRLPAGRQVRVDEEAK